MTKYIIKPTTQFKKDLKIAEKSHRNISLSKKFLQNPNLCGRIDVNGIF